MSDALRKEYTGTTGRSCFDTHDEPWPNYVYWLEASLLSEREKAKELTEIHENDEESIRALGRTFDSEREKVKDLELRMNVAYWDGIKKDNGKLREKVARLTAENERMRGLLKRAYLYLDSDGYYSDLTDEIEAFFSPAPDAPKPGVSEIHDEYCPCCEMVTKHDPAVLASECDRCKVLHEPVEKPGVCRWTWNDDPYPGGWRTSCKNAHGNIDGKGKTPVGVCPYCGLPIEEVKE